MKRTQPTRLYTLIIGSFLKTIGLFLFGYVTLFIGAFYKFGRGFEEDLIEDFFEPFYWILKDFSEFAFTINPISVPFYGFCMFIFIKDYWKSNKVDKKA